MQKLPCNTMLNYIFYRDTLDLLFKLQKCQNVNVKKAMELPPRVEEAAKKCDNVGFSLNLFKWWNPIIKELKLILKRSGQKQGLLSRLCLPIWTDMLQSISRNNGNVVECWNWTIEAICIPMPHAFWGENWQKLKTVDSVTKISVSSNFADKTIKSF